MVTIRNKSVHILYINEYDVLSAHEQFTFYLCLLLRISQFVSHSFAVFCAELISSELGSMSGDDKLSLVTEYVGWVFFEEKIKSDETENKVRE